MADPDWLPAVAVAPFIGSFLALVVVRLPAGEAVVFGRSACRNCGHFLAPRDLVPLLSWLLSRGHCRYCAGRISALYPVVELAATTVAASALLALPGWLVLPSCVFGWALLALALIDLREGVLPDRLTLPLIPMGWLVAVMTDQGGLVDHLAGASLGFLAFAGVALAYRRLRGRDGLGGGDARLLAASGAWVAWQGLPSVVLIAALLGLGTVLLRAARGASPGLSDRMSFGPYLCLATWLVWLLGPLQLID